MCLKRNLASGESSKNDPRDWNFESNEIPFEKKCTYTYIVIMMIISLYLVRVLYFSQRKFNQLLLNMCNCIF